MYTPHPPPQLRTEPHNPILADREIRRMQRPFVFSPDHREHPNCPVKLTCGHPNRNALVKLNAGALPLAEFTLRPNPGALPDCGKRSARCEPANVALT